MPPQLGTVVGSPNPRTRLISVAIGTSRINLSALPEPGSSSVDRSFCTAKLVYNPAEIRRLAQNHTLHGSVVPVDHGTQFRLRNQSHRSGQGLFESFPGLPKGDDVVAPNRLQQVEVLDNVATARGAEFLEQSCPRPVRQTAPDGRVAVNNENPDRHDGRRDRYLPRTVSRFSCSARERKVANVSFIRQRLGRSRFSERAVTPNRANPGCSGAGHASRCRANGVSRSKRRGRP